MRIALVVLLLWPFHHTESGVIHLPKSGVAIAGFKHFFHDIPKCTFHAQHPVKARAISREWIEFVGEAGDPVTWTCK